MSFFSAARPVCYVWLLVLLVNSEVLLIKMIVRSPVNPILPGKFIQLVIYHRISELHVLFCQDLAYDSFLLFESFLRGVCVDIEKENE